MSADIQDAIRSILKTVREVEEWRAEHDPGTPEWHTLCDLADQVNGLISRLPIEMQPAPTVDELIELMGL